MSALALLPFSVLARAGENLVHPPIDLTKPVDARRVGEGPKLPVSHFDWAAGIARRISRWLNFRPRSSEEADLVAHAHFTLVRKLVKFSPRPCYLPGENVHGHFRGWVHMSLRAECVREANRMRSGGTYRTPKDARHVVIEGLPTRRTETGIEEVELACHRSAEVTADEGDEREPCKRRWNTDTGEEAITMWAEQLLCRSVSRKLMRLYRRFERYESRLALDGYKQALPALTRALARAGER